MARKRRKDIRETEEHITVIPRRLPIVKDRDRIAAARYQAEKLVEVMKKAAPFGVEIYMNSVGGVYMESITG